MGFFKAVGTCLRKYFTFSGRAARSEYWYFVLFLFLGSLAAGFADVSLFGTVTQGANGVVAQADGRISGLFSALMFVPALAAGWRRMHDTGRSGLFLLYPVIVMIGVSAFVGFMAGFDTVLAGDVDGTLSALGDAVAAVSVAALIVSPFLVLWWLTRPGDDGANEYGVPPGTGHYQ